MRELLKSKIHHAIVTHTDLYYEWSLFIDSYLLEQANILPNEKVEVTNINNWLRWSTYAVPMEKNSWIVSVNWWWARLSAIGDKLIIMAFEYTDKENIDASIITLNDDNTIKSSK